MTIEKSMDLLAAHMVIIGLVLIVETSGVVNGDTAALLGVVHAVAGLDDGLLHAHIVMFSREDGK